MDSSSIEGYAEGITVLICTYNGAYRIEPTLQHLAQQKVTLGLPWEILLIDNASKDNVAQVAGEVWQKLGSIVSLTVLNEPTPGKDNAMDRGLAVATYQYVVVCDDDNWLDPNYLQQAWQILRANPSIGMLGGRSRGVFEKKLPAWFDPYKGYYAVGSQNQQSGELPANRFLWGAGTVINRKAYTLLKKANFQRIITYSQYPAISRGEDVEMCFAVRLTGYKVWYDERLQLSHFMPNERIRWDYLLELTKVSGLMVPIISIYQGINKGVMPRKILGKAWLRITLQRVFHFNIPGTVAYLTFRKQKEGDAVYQQKLFRYYSLVGYLSANSRFDFYWRQTEDLQKRLLLLREQYQETVPGDQLLE